jgi:Cu/Ag efflux protein CusF
MLRRTFALMAVVALAVFVGTAFADEPKPGAHEGKVVKVEPGKLTMSDKDGKNQHAHAIPATTKITLDGKPAKLEDLKPGNMVKVMVEKQDDKFVVVSIDAKKAD